MNTPLEKSCFAAACQYQLVSWNNSLTQQCFPGAWYQFFGAFSILKKVSSSAVQTESGQTITMC